MVAKGVQKIKNYHMTPSTGRVTMMFSKEQGKVLKKLGIDLELAEDETIFFAIKLLDRMVTQVDITGLSRDQMKEKLMNFIPGDQTVPPLKE